MNSAGAAVELQPLISVAKGHLGQGEAGASLHQSATENKEFILWFAQTGRIPPVFWDVCAAIGLTEKNVRKCMKIQGEVLAMQTGSRHFEPSMIGEGTFLQFG